MLGRTEIASLLPQFYLASGPAWFGNKRCEIDQERWRQGLFGKVHSRPPGILLAPGGLPHRCYRGGRSADFEVQSIVGSALRREARRIHADKGYRGHSNLHRLRVCISGQVRRVTASIRREMKRRADVEPVIGHVKAEHRMERNYLKGRVGDRINAALAGAG